MEFHEVVRHLGKIKHSRMQAMVRREGGAPLLCAIVVSAIKYWCNNTNIEQSVMEVEMLAALTTLASYLPSQSTKEALRLIMSALYRFNDDEGKAAKKLTNSIIAEVKFYLIKGFVSQECFG